MIDSFKFDYNNNLVKFMSKKFQTVKGMRDFLPEEAILRESVFDTVKRVFEKFGFSPAITPSLEYYEVFANKYAIGEENLKNIYEFKDKSDRRLALRFDQTVPLARLVASNPQLPKPFKRYEISRVWRYEEIKRGRYREFWQCDIDTIGSKSMLADAEIISCSLEALKELGLKVYMRINNRKLLSDMLVFSGVDKNKMLDVLRTIDKLDKFGLDYVKKELKKYKLSNKSIEKIAKIISIKGKAEDVLEKVRNIISESEGINELNELLKYLKDMVDEESIMIDISLARGLDYYTSTIFELVSEDKNIGSLAGGGRYDNMIGKFAETKEEIPAVGIALGIERIIELIKNRKEKSVTSVFIVSVNDSVISDVFKVAKKLRQKGINTEIDVMGRSISKQLEYVNNQEIPFVVFIGPKEIQAGKYKLRDMKNGKESELTIDEIIEKIKRS